MADPAMMEVVGDGEVVPAGIILEGGAKRRKESEGEVSESGPPIKANKVAKGEDCVGKDFSHFTLLSAGFVVFGDFLRQFSSVFSDFCTKRFVSSFSIFWCNFQSGRLSFRFFVSV